MYDQSCTREKLEQKLQDPGKFLTLDTKLSAAFTRSAGGDLATRILNYKEQQSRKGTQVRGRYVLLMFKDYFKTSEEASRLYRVEDLLGVVTVGATVQDLRRFVNKWDATLAGMATTPEDAVLRDILLRSVLVRCWNTTLRFVIVHPKRPMRSLTVSSISPWRIWSKRTAEGEP